MLKGRKILVTGASGYLGSWMAEYARREGADVRILVPAIPRYLEQWASQFDVIEADITDPSTLTSACKDREVVWHTASVNETVTEPNPEMGFQVNVLGTYNVLASAADAGVGRFIKFSTFHVYGSPSNQKITEETAVAPLSIYALTNFFSEECGRQCQRTRGMRVVTARISNGYGAPLFKEINRWTLVVNDLAKMAIERGELVLKSPGTQTRDFVSIADVFQAVSLLSVIPLEQDIFNVGGRTTKSILDIARLVQSCYQARYGTAISIRAPEAASAANEAVSFDISRILRLGYNPEDRFLSEIQRTFDLLES